MQILALAVVVGKKNALSQSAFSLKHTLRVVLEPDRDHRVQPSVYDAGFLRLSVSRSSISAPLEPEAFCGERLEALWSLHTCSITWTTSPLHDWRRASSASVALEEHPFCFPVAASVQGWCSLF